MDGAVLLKEASARERESLRAKGRRAKAERARLALSAQSNSVERKKQLQSGTDMLVAGDYNGSKRGGSSRHHHHQRPNRQHRRGHGYVSSDSESSVELLGTSLGVAAAGGPESGLSPRLPRDDDVPASSKSKKKKNKNKDEESATDVNKSGATAASQLEQNDGGGDDKKKKKKHRKGTDGDGHTHDPDDKVLESSSSSDDDGGGGGGGEKAKKKKKKHHRDDNDTVAVETAASTSAASPAASTAPATAESSKKSEKAPKGKKKDDDAGKKGEHDQDDADAKKKTKKRTEKAGDQPAAQETNIKPEPAAAAAAAAAPTKKKKKAATAAKKKNSAAAGPLHGSFGVAEDMNKEFKGSMEDGFVSEPALSAHRAYFAVYDGHSGRIAVDLAMERLHGYLLEALDQEGLSPPDALKASYDRVDKEIKPLSTSAGTTAVSALFERDASSGQRILHVANVGDARAVLCRGKGGAGQIERLSYDHKVSDEAEKLRCEDMGATFIWGRLQGQVMITRALGDWDIAPYCTAEPFYNSVQLDDQAAKPTWLLLACDGIFDVMSDEEAMQVGLAVADQGPQAMADALISESLAKKTKDNLTAMFIAL